MPGLQSHNELTHWDLGYSHNELTHLELDYKATMG